eukprot:9002463-Lingulodinium_polyedra.AAC.1
MLARVRAATMAISLLSSTGLAALMSAEHAEVLSMNHRRSLPLSSLRQRSAASGPASSSPWPTYCVLSFHWRTTWSG